MADPNDPYGIRNLLMSQPRQGADFASNPLSAVGPPTSAFIGGR